jgi:hypothetical protein
VAVAACLKRGARGYVVKQDAEAELVPAIQTVLTGQFYLSAHVHRAGNALLTSVAAPATTPNPASRVDRVAARPLTAAQRATLHERVAQTVRRARQLVHKAQATCAWSRELEAQLRRNAAARQQKVPA